jgi:ribosomal protein S18 acetylase RimI-like enzyme
MSNEQRGSTSVSIRRAGVEILDDLEPLWRATYGHHAATAPYLGELRSIDESWSRRRGRYQAELEQPGSFVLAAERGGRLIAYVVAATTSGSDIWATGDPIGKVENMSVLPDERGGAIGSSLMREFCRAFLEQGIENISFEAMVRNEAAIDLFERWGGLPTTMHFRLSAARGLAFDTITKGRQPAAGR